MNTTPRCSGQEYQDLLHERQLLELQIQTRALADPAFREALLKNPRQALADLTGTELPESLTVNVREETPTKAYLRIPSPPKRIKASEELSDEALESVAGGGVIVVLDTANGGMVLVAGSRRRHDQWGFVVY